jgi:penicillin-binding protein 1C
MAVLNKQKIRLSLISLACCIILTISLFKVADTLFPFDYHVPFSQVILADDSTLLHVYLSSDDKWRLETGLDEISPVLKKTILYKEDRYFFYHFGVNPFSVVRALVINTLRRQRLSGASTVTMQVARLLHPAPRTYKNKIIEMFRATQLEWHLSKTDILRLYLSLVPYGGNIEGVKSAALIYFRQKPQALSLAQAVTLAVIPNDPKKLHLGKDNEAIKEERNRWLRTFGRRHLFGEQEIADALDEPLDAARHDPPALIPHLAARLHASDPGRPVLQTCIDPALQAAITDIVKSYISRLIPLGITNASVLVVTNKTRQVKAYVGSADFNDDVNGGQVDGVRAVRSPGSTLKPFLYALAMDEGLATPRLVVNDVPYDFNGYSPENYDQDYRGYVTVEDALALSLNVPAVKMLSRLPLNRFLDKMSEAGFESVRHSRDELGLSVILGGCGVTLEELTGLYGTFANGGVFMPPVLTAGSPAFAPDTLFSDAAAYMVTGILTLLKRPDLPSQYKDNTNMHRVAWKTGTSYGRRDAWSLGYDMEYTVGVWVGDFAGKGIPELNGSEYAAPLLFSVFKVLGDRPENEWFTTPATLDFRLVCSRTGLPPNDFCRDLVMDYFIPGVSPTGKCMHMKEVFTDAGETFSYCRACLPTEGYRKALYPNHPPEIIRFFESRHIPYEKVPPHNPACPRLFTGIAPVITSPVDGSEYILIKGKNQQLMLSCQVENDVSNVFWYLNDRFFKASEAASNIFFQPFPGKVKISCTDDKGRNCDIWINVVYMSY